MDAKVKTLWSGGLKTLSLIRGFEVETDKPKIHFGTNTAAAPAELFIASIGACFVSTFALFAFHKRLTIDEITADIKAKIGKKKEVEEITSITLTVKVWSDSKFQSQLEKCFITAKKTCSLTKAIKVPIEFSIEYKMKK
ncbi:MAG: OsmC family protein [Thermoplasmata archaeon]|nr:OsmC family protein [Thermoplasmata archaeon]